MISPDSPIKPARQAPPYIAPPAETLVTLYCDDALIVADKPSGLLSVPGRGPEKAACVVSYLSERHGPVLTVHRLDMDTSGLMVFARTPPAQKALSRQFERRDVEKTYEAIVAGHLEPENGRVDKPIAKYSLSRPLRHCEPGGQEAITDWQILSKSRRATRVRLHPKTGRSHQLRLHMKEIGHPILGDPFYGDETRASRLLLQATSLGFSHPETAKPMQFFARARF